MIPAATLEAHIAIVKLLQTVLIYFLKKSYFKYYILLLCKTQDSFYSQNWWIDKINRSFIGWISSLQEKSDIIHIFHEDRNLPSFQQFWLLFSIGKSLTPYPTVSLGHQKLTCCFCLLTQQAFQWMLPSFEMESTKETHWIQSLSCAAFLYP